MAMIQIIKDRPIPPSRGGRGNTATEYPWRVMEVGDCFEVPASKWGDLKRTQVFMSAMAGTAGKRLGRKFITRRTGDAVAVWRIA